MTSSPDVPVGIVSCDSHVGPTFAQLREHCPQRHLAAFDEFAAQVTKFDIFAEMRELIARYAPPDEIEARTALLDLNLRTAGHHDMDARRRDMDADGVAVDVVFHSSQNGQVIPFVPGGSLWFQPSRNDFEMAAVGYRIFNSWLAEACATAPDRHLGVAQVPAWDIDATLAEVEWAAAAGLRSINLPAPRPGIPVYDHPDWESVWAACASHGVPLNTHVGGAGGDAELIGLHRYTMMMVDGSGWLSRRALPRLIFSGVFERHPGLRYILTEQNGDWWTATMREYDSAYREHGWFLKEVVPRPPSEYCAEQVFIGGSYLAPFEAQMALDGAYTGNLLWGSDYPHFEGTYQYADDPSAPNATRIALRHAMAGVPEPELRAILGENAARCFGITPSELAAVAARIGAPTPSELAEPVGGLPTWTGSKAFRTIGPWG